MDQPPLHFWGISATEMLQRLHTAKDGLTADEARQRLARYGSKLLTPRKRSDLFTLLLGQFKSPIILILLFATGLSFVLRDPVDAFIILAIVVVSGLLGFWQERSATNAVEKLLAIVQVKTAALRDGSPTEIPVAEIVPGDVVILNAGGIIPGDCLVQESRDLFVDEATLTGVNYPVEKSVGVLDVRYTDAFNDPYVYAELTRTTDTMQGPQVNYLFRPEETTSWYLGISVLRWSRTEVSTVTGASDSASVTAPFFGGGWTARLGKHAYFNIGIFLSPGAELKTDTGVSSEESSRGFDIQLQLGLVF